MAETINEAMTAIADTIRHNAMNNDDPIERPLSLDDMPDAISQVRNGGYYKGYQQGYEEGEEFGFYDGWVDNENMVVGELHKPVRKVEDYTSVECDPVDSVGTIRYIDENLSKVYENGQKSEWDKFWDVYQNNGKLRYSDHLFGSPGWTNDTFKPKYDIKYTSAAGMFTNSTIEGSLTQILKDNNITLTNANTNFGGNTMQMFYNSKFTQVPEIEMRNCTTTTQMFSTNTLVTIDGIVSNENTVYASNAFKNCTALKNIAFKGVIGTAIDFQYSPLSKESIISIVNALKVDASGKTLTLKKSAVNTAFGINVDDTSTYPAGSEYYTLRHSKDNWTFSYV